MSVIKINYIELIFNRLIEKFKMENIAEISFEDDMYWNVPVENIATFPSEPELSVGSLDDDINFLKSLIDEDYTTDFLELERLSTVLKFMSKRLTFKQ
jgi:hypothetical protein